MGEARRRKSYKRELLDKNKFCIYCGGSAVSEEVDHVPAKMMFRNKHRPAGLEVPSCSLCNRNASKFEVIANALGRIGFGELQSVDQIEFSRLLKDAESNNPGFILELNPTKANMETVRRFGFPPGSGAFKVDGPIVSGAINRFAAKLGFALHWAETGRIVPIEGAVLTRWFSNYDKMTGSFPNDLMNVLGGQKTLSQGKFSVHDRFSYRVATADTGAMGIYFSAFQFSFATLSFVTEDLSNTIPLSEYQMFRPGFLR